MKNKNPKIHLTFFKQYKNIEQSFKITFPHSLTFEWKIYEYTMAFYFLSDFVFRVLLFLSYDKNSKLSKGNILSLKKKMLYQK